MVSSVTGKHVRPLHHSTVLILTHLQSAPPGHAMVDKSLNELVSINYRFFVPIRTSWLIYLYISGYTFAIGLITPRLYVTLPSPLWYRESRRLFRIHIPWGSTTVFTWYLYFLLRCLSAEPASVFVVLLVFLLLKALLAFLATLLDVLGAFAIVKSFSCCAWKSNPVFWAYETHVIPYHPPAVCFTKIRINCEITKYF